MACSFARTLEHVFESAEAYYTRDASSCSAAPAAIIPFPFLVSHATRRPSFADPEFVITSREPRNRNFAGYDVRYRELD